MLTENEGARPVVHYIRVLKRRWALVALVGMVTIGGAAAYSFTQQPIYRSSFKAFFDLPADERNATNPTTQTMASLVLTFGVAEQVKADLGLPDTPEDLLSRLGTVTEPDTPTLEVRYDDPDPDRGIRVVEDVAKVFQRRAQAILDDQAKLSKDEARVIVTVPDPPYLVGKVQPQPVRNIAVAAVLGLFLGIVAAFVREQFDDTLRGAEEAEEAFGRPPTAILPPKVLGYRPFGPRRRRGPDPVVTELILQRLAADIVWSPEGADTRTLLVTSANPEEGKTTIAANLAVELAASGHKVIVVEADLRRPVLGQHLGLDRVNGTIGLDTVLRGQATITAAMVEVPVWDRTGSPPPSGTPEGRRLSQGHLRAIVAGPGHVWPSEVGMERITEILGVLKSRADYVVLDAPPILVVPDAYPLVSAVDAVVAVVRSGRSTASATAAMSALLVRLRARRVHLVLTEAEAPFGQTYRAYVTPRSSKRDRAAAAISPGPV